MLRGSSSNTRSGLTLTCIASGIDAYHPAATAAPRAARSTHAGVPPEFRRATLDEWLRSRRRAHHGRAPVAERRGPSL